MMVRSYDNIKRTETEFDPESCQSWLSSMLPSERNDIFNIIVSCKLTRNKTTTRKFENVITILPAHPSGRTISKH